MSATQKVPLTNTPVNISDGLTAGTSFSCQNRGADLYFESTADLANPPENHEHIETNFIRANAYFSLHVRSGIADWCWTRGSKTTTIMINST